MVIARVSSKFGRDFNTLSTVSWVLTTPTPTPLYCFAKKGFKFSKVPEPYCIEALKRAIRVAADPTKTRVEHIYGPK
jgi:hypothetical protein